MSHRKANRNGIVLLIALGMLSLFSVMIVTYVVFSSQQNQIAYSIAKQKDEALLPKAPIELALTSLVTGSKDPRSPAYMNDVLGDLYGTDHLRLHVAHQRLMAPTVDFNYQGMLLRPLFTNGVPLSTLFKIPLNLAYWNDNATDVTGAALSGKFDQPLPIDMVNGQFTNANWKVDLTARNLPDYRLNDAFTGRLLTFSEGP